MAETLTVNTDPQTETVGTDLTADEQDSLAVGEKLVAEQEQLLAGKYKDAESLEKAYVELQQKLGEKSNESNELTTEDTVEDEVETDEKDTEPREISAAETLINEASTEYYDSGGLTEETMSKFTQMSSKDLVNAYMEMTKNNPQTTDQTSFPEDLSQGDVNTIKNSVGGEAEYNNMVSWASQNLDQNTVQAFDSLLDTGNAGAIQLAVNGLKQQYENAVGYDGQMLTGKAPKSSGDVFRSQPELVAAMSDPRYENDPAYRQDIIEKLDRSDLAF